MVSLKINSVTIIDENGEKKYDTHCRFQCDKSSFLNLEIKRFQKYLKVHIYQHCKLAFKCLFYKSEILNQSVIVASEMFF